MANSCGFLDLSQALVPQKTPKNPLGFAMFSCSKPTRYGRLAPCDPPLPRLHAFVRATGAALGQGPLTLGESQVVLVERHPGQRQALSHGSLRLGLAGELTPNMLGDMSTSHPPMVPLKMVMVQ